MHVHAVKFAYVLCGIVRLLMVCDGINLKLQHCLTCLALFTWHVHRHMNSR